MKRTLRWRYYCDFCKRSSGGSLKKHEVHCTMNPGRICRLCAFLEEEQAPVAALAAALYTSGLAGLREAAHNCPACILAAIRQLQPGDTNEVYEFDFKKELAQVFCEANDLAYEREMHREWYG